MKLLLDECVDARLASELPGHNVTTVPLRGWANTKDSQLLENAQHEFDVLITVDRNLPFQQNLSRFNIAVVILIAPTNRISDLQMLVPQLLRVLPKTQKGEAVLIERS